MYLEVTKATKQIGRDLVLHDVNLSLERGTVCALVGSNGSGKTMLMKAICGMIFLTEGSVTIDGKVIGKDISFPESLGALIEKPGMLGGYTGFENLWQLAGIRKKIGEKEILEAMERTGILEAGNKKFRKYSLGMKQRLGIAAALMEKPDLLFLDEPTNALDKQGREDMLRIIREEKERGALVILASHEEKEVQEVADVICQMRNGEIE